MNLNQDSADRIIFRDESTSFMRLIRIFLIVCVATVVAAALLNGNYFSVVLVLLVAALFWKLANYANVTSTVTLDRQTGQLTLVQARGGKILSDRSERLEAIDNVVLQSSSRSEAADETLKTRPAFIVRGEPVPLTFASFVSGEEPKGIALALRAFLGLPRENLIDDSINEAVKAPAGTGPAVRLARFGKGMNRLEAASYVQELKKKRGSQ